MKLSDNKVELVRRHNKVVYQDGDRIVKVFNESKPASDVFNEALNLARIQETSIKVPKIREVSRVEEGPERGQWALATGYVPGINALQAVSDDPEHAQKHMDKFVDLQVAIQSVDAPAVARQKDKLLRMVKKVKTIDPSIRYELEMRIDGMRPGLKVCHGDFIQSNVIVGDDGELYVCDWAHVTAGLPEVDAATTYLLFQVKHPEYAEMYLDTYSKRADVAKQVIQFWLPVVAAAELSRGRKVHEEMLMSLVDASTDYE